MGDSIHWIKHVELHVNSSATPSQQVASVDAVAALLKNDLLTLEVLVREMELYLTTTDNIIRSRGILFLADVVAQLTSKPLSDTTIHSLIGFFTEKLADWKALRGAIVGCLALLRRKNIVGMVNECEAKAVAQSYLQHLEVQSLGHYDRKLSFQLMECLLDRYFGAIQDLADNLVHGICEAIDGERDPRCLLLVFRIVETVARVYPGDSGPLADYAEELFEILGQYFPIHFTHPKGEDSGKREELSKALMMAFAATPLFEPFSIPLLLEKLSSSLPLAKAESLKYLSFCITKYGSERIAKHAGAIWSSIKDVTYINPHSTLSQESEPDGMGFQDSDIMMQAYALLQEVSRECVDFISLVIGDKDIDLFMNSLDQYKDIGGISLQDKQRLHVVSRILSTCAKSSILLCNKVFESFFQLLVNSLGLSVAQQFENNHLDENSFCPDKPNFGALYLCVELLAACRCLSVSLDNCTSHPEFSHQICYSMVTCILKLLMKVFISLLRSDIADNEKNGYLFYGVKGLQILATFPGSFLPVPKALYDNILLELVSIVASNGNQIALWKLSLKALVEIGFFIDKYPDHEKVASFQVVVVEKIVSLMSSYDLAIPISLKLQSAFEIGMTNKDFMLRVACGLEQSIYTNISAALLDENQVTVELTAKLLDTYSQKVIPWFIEVGGLEEIPRKFALNIWDKIENVMSMSHTPLKISSDLLVATMNAMKNAVASCSERSQEMIIKKALGVISSGSSIGLKRSSSGCCILKEESSHQTPSGNPLVTSEWVTSLFASVVIALRPQTSIPKGKMILQIFITSLLDGHIPSAHALGSLVNKLPSGTMEMNTSEILDLNEALDMIFHIYSGTSCNSVPPGNDYSGINLSCLRLKTATVHSLTNYIIGLAWIGKGLLMRGHERLKDITMTLLGFVMFNHESEVSKQFENEINVYDEKDVHQLMQCAGDAFRVIMSDSLECLNRTYHAHMKPLYKQHFFCTIKPILLSLVVNTKSSLIRSMLYRALAHVVIETPLIAILGEAKKLVPALLGCLSQLKDDASVKEIIYSILLIVSAILVEKIGREAAVENAPGIANQLIELTTYSHKMAVRETALQCLVAMSELPHSRIYPLKKQVLLAASRALDDPRRSVRCEACKCRRAWDSIA
ncbi:MMS19 nucleotide excision repair protein homolog isoform X2 [Andrographis paniculata]|uniref:MMS19 nucleotide excision repair protein homolog isoform X2 n=1 Tax=Andrographis paniculata TaxID=175694 RepID=UPI0021E995FD|nr:MMS19 nucleotide excision repair protein homolog isoform X2 [Andrographis paniculata]